MAGFIQVIQKDYKSGNLKTLRDDLKARKDPDFFWPNGTQVYCGRQGSGKTISAVKHVIELKRRYPKCEIVTNLNLNVKFAYTSFSTMEELSELLVSVNNGKYGVIYLIDEIHTYFNALDSKNIPMFVFTEISQQRKQRKLIIGTSQLFMRLAKPFREQCDNIVVCKTVMGVVTFQTAYDGMEIEQDYDGSLIGNPKKKGFFVHTRKIRQCFDTFQKVVSANEQYENNKPLNMVLDKKQVKKLAR